MKTTREIPVKDLVPDVFKTCWRRESEEVVVVLWWPVLVPRKTGPRLSTDVLLLDENHVVRVTFGRFDGEYAPDDCEGREQRLRTVTTASLTPLSVYEGTTLSVPGTTGSFSSLSDPFSSSVYSISRRTWRTV